MVIVYMLCVLIGVYICKDKSDTDERAAYSVYRWIVKKIRDKDSVVQVPTLSVCLSLTLISPCVYSRAHYFAVTYHIHSHAQINFSQGSSVWFPSDETSTTSTIDVSNDQFSVPGHSPKVQVCAVCCVLCAVCCVLYLCEQYCLACCRFNCVTDVRTF